MGKDISSEFRVHVIFLCFFDKKILNLGLYYETIQEKNMPLSYATTKVTLIG